MSNKWQKENDVDDYVKGIFASLGLVKNNDYYEKTGSPFMQEALKGASKTIKATGTGLPDFIMEKYIIKGKVIPIIFESKLGILKFLQTKEGEIGFTQQAVSAYALNGALHYARSIISSEKYSQAIAVGISGEDEKNVKIGVYFVFGSSSIAYKDTGLNNINFLESQSAFEAFYQHSKLTESDKHIILAKSQDLLEKHSKKLNKLMHNHNITAPQRVLYVSGMILAMQKIYDIKFSTLRNGLDIDSLKSLQDERDGVLILKQIETFLRTKITDSKKLNLMLSSFSEIAKDPDRDKILKAHTHKQGEKSNPNDKIVAHLLQTPSSINKQIFAYIYTHIYSEIDGISGHLDIMGQMYSEF